MNTINDIVHDIELATNFQINKIILREKIISDIHMVYNGGIFKITQELLSFVATWPDDTVYLEDTHQNPIKVSKDEFLSLAREHYHKVMNVWHNEYEKIRKIRKI
jgi:predicted double-glycine peptidase